VRSFYIIFEWNPKEFYGGIFIRDEKIVMIMAEFYQQMWEKASENIDVIK
jgi:hypothetical protein